MESYQSGLTKIAPIWHVRLLVPGGVNLGAAVLLLLPCLPVVLVVADCDLVRHSGSIRLDLIQEGVPDLVVPISILQDLTTQCAKNVFLQSLIWQRDVVKIV